MKPQSAKAKGRTLQKWVRSTILDLFTSLEKDDVKSTSMGSGGEDVMLSPAARKVVPYQIECKSNKSIAVYRFYEQAVAHGQHEPLVVIKENHKQPLVVVDASHFFQLLKKVSNEA